MLAGNLHQPAHAIGRTCIQRAAVRHAARRIAEQLDHAAHPADPLSLDNPAIVHDRLQQGVPGLGRQDHRPIGRYDRAAILHRGV